MARSAILTSVRFAQAMSDMRFLFDEDLEHFVSDIYVALLKKHALDILLEKADGRAKALTDQVLMVRLARRADSSAPELATEFIGRCLSIWSDLCVLSPRFRPTDRPGRRRSRPVIPRAHSFRKILGEDLKVTASNSSTRVAQIKSRLLLPRAVPGTTDW